MDFFDELEKKTDPIESAIFNLLSRLSEAWLSVSPLDWTHTQQTAMTLLIWSGVAQARIQLSAAEPDGRKGRGVALGWGKWRDVANRELRNAGIRRAQVQVLVDAIRLSREGVEVRNVLTEGVGLDPLHAILFIKTTIKPGVFNIQSYEAEQTGPATAAQAIASASVGDIVVNVHVPDSAKPTEKPKRKKAQAPRQAPRIRPLTPRQQEAWTTYTRTRSIVETANLLQIRKQAAWKLIKAAQRKLATATSQASGRSVRPNEKLPEDRRGQADIPDE